MSSLHVKSLIRSPGSQFSIAFLERNLVLISKAREVFKYATYKKPQQKCPRYLQKFLGMCKSEAVQSAVSLNHPYLQLRAKLNCQRCTNQIQSKAFKRRSSGKPHLNGAPSYTLKGS